MKEKKDPADAKVQPERREAGGQGSSIIIVIITVPSAVHRRSGGPRSRCVPGVSPPSERLGPVEDQGVRQHRRKRHHLY